MQLYIFVVRLSIKLQFCWCGADDNLFLVFGWKRQAYHCQATRISHQYLNKSKIKPEKNGYAV